jgi:SAM-dependent methyltransferase
MDRDVARRWVERWETQQDHVIDGRAERFEVMLDVLAALCGADDAAPGRGVVVLDLASGPAGISVRVLERFPGARCIAVDLDPVLLAIGQAAHGDAGGRLTWVEHDLRASSWPDAVRRAAGRDHVDAVLTSTALHWIPSDALIDVYRACAALLAPGGVLVNADNMDPPAGNPTLRRLADGVAAARADAVAAAAARGAFEGWTQWWDAVAASPSLAALHRDRADRYAWRDLDAYRPGVAVHVAALEEAGFREVDTVWQRSRNRVLVAVR